jgi:hypothetical protein
LAGYSSTPAEVEDVRRKLERAAENLGLAENGVQRRAMAVVFERLDLQRQASNAEVFTAKGLPRAEADPESEAATALALLERLDELAADPANLPAVGEPAARLEARVFLRFGEAS